MKASKGLGPPIEVIGLSVIQAGTFLTKVKSPSAHSVEWTICNLHDKSKHKFSPQVQQLRQQQQQTAATTAAPHLHFSSRISFGWLSKSSVFAWMTVAFEIQSHWWGFGWLESNPSGNRVETWSGHSVEKTFVFGSRGGADDFCPNEPPLKKNTSVSLKSSSPSPIIMF